MCVLTNSEDIEISIAFRGQTNYGKHRLEKSNTVKMFEGEVMWKALVKLIHLFPSFFWNRWWLEVPCWYADGRKRFIPGVQHTSVPNRACNIHPHWDVKQWSWCSGLWSRWWSGAAEGLIVVTLFVYLSMKLLFLPYQAVCKVLDVSRLRSFEAELSALRALALHPHDCFPILVCFDSSQRILVTSPCVKHVCEWSVHMLLFYS